MMAMPGSSFALKVLFAVAALLFVIGLIYGLARVMTRLSFMSRHLLAKGKRDHKAPVTFTHFSKGPEGLSIYELMWRGQPVLVVKNDRYLYAVHASMAQELEKAGHDEI